MPFASLFLDTRLATPAEAMRRLTSLRWLSAAGMAATVLATPRLLGLPLPTATLLAIAAALALFNLVVTLHARWRQNASAPVLFCHLCVDLAAWSAFLYFTGGAANPLISLLLPLVAIGAAVLPAIWAWALALLAIAAYSLLWSYNVELEIYDEDLAVRWHLAGMWLSFALSAVVIVSYIARMMAAIRSRDEALAAAREAQLRNERIVALGNLAAGAAHELGTPLATMAVVAGELVRDPGLSDDNRADAELLREQLAHCKSILGNLTLRAGSLRAEGGEIVPACAWLDGVIQRWRSLRP
ncbi:MAG: sensor histidine kinase, partial [Zoogloea sp.]|nr:sensor histidine kinase [Zoogloea sp.]